VSHPIDVGSVLGGRYKVTANVLTSHDQDLVLDGVDQVLNRPVSILVAGPDNTEQVAQSAREVATGERPGTVQVLDLGVTEAATYLITNHTSAADLLDLVVASNPPYVEPFFTDTLGSEIFGQARSHEPEPYDDEDHVDAGYIKYSDDHQGQAGPYRANQPVVPPRPPVRPASSPAAGAAGAGAAAGMAGAGAGAVAAGAISQQATAPQPVQRDGHQQNVPLAGNFGRGDTAEAASPKVSLWNEEDYEYGQTSRKLPTTNLPLPSHPARKTVPQASSPPSPVPLDRQQRPLPQPRRPSRRRTTRTMSLSASPGPCAGWSVACSRWFSLSGWSSP